MPKAKKKTEGELSLEELRKQAYAAIEEERWDDVITLSKTLIERADAPDGDAILKLGVGYGGKGQYEKAIECYQKALDTPGFDTPGAAWNNMGIAYDDKGEYEKAIECYQKALNTPGYDTPGDAWNNMGTAYDAIRKYEKAIECYQNALDTPGFGAPGHSWYNKGAALKKLPRLKDALDAFTQAAKCYRDAGMLDNAKDAEEKIEAVRLAQRVGAEASSELYPATSAARPAGSEANVNPDDPIHELRKLEQEAKVKGKEYHAAFKDSGRREKMRNALVFLKGWSSSEPFLDNESDIEYSVRGGGLFLRWKRKGVVIDPGINFLSNFHGAGYFVQDIDAIVVTHDHIDHTLDFHAIDDLAYQMRQFDNPKRKRYCFFSKPACDSLREHLQRSDAYIIGVPFGDILEGAEKPRRHSCMTGVTLAPFKTNHSEASFGLNCILKDGAVPEVRIGITSDTTFFDQLPEHLKDCQLIVAHISNPESEEYENPEHLKSRSKHLGLNGTRKLIEQTNAQVYVITEFWSGRGDRRVPLCQKLVYDLEKVSKVTGKCVVPADVGLTIEFHREEDGSPCFKMKCTSCGSLTKCQDVTVVRPDKPYGPIRYLCPECKKRLMMAYK